MENIIPDIIIDRAAELWCRAIRRPTFDNGDNSFAGTVGMALAAKIANDKINGNPEYEASVEKFRAALSTKLKFLRDNNNKPKPQEEIDKEKAAGNDRPFDHYYFNSSLGCDYGPCQTLTDAAKEAGLSKNIFPIKTRMWITHEFVSMANGYAATEIKHYPLPNGKWLLCNLGGNEMPVIIQAVAEGRLPELVVEDLA